MIDGTVPVVTDEMLDAALSAYHGGDYKGRLLGCSGEADKAARDGMREAVAAAIAAAPDAPGEPTLTQYRSRAKGSPDYCWSDWRERRPAYMDDPTSDMEVQTRHLYTHPAPAQAVVESNTTSAKAVDAIFKDLRDRGVLICRRDGEELNGIGLDTKWTIRAAWMAIISDAVRMAPAPAQKEHT